MLTEKIKNSISESILCWLATSSPDGEPNCSPKEVFTYRGDNELIIADIASPGSVENIQLNPRVCVSFVHVFKQTGFKLKGNAEYISKDEKQYDELFALIEPIVGTIFPVKGIIVVDVKSCQPIIAPAYFLVDGTTEESQIQSAKRTYGV
ncbi:pyridoxamine 5'-phosphate oxidase family protein [Marinimicrobium sp. ABcell2]|uniref:pyridoxamine 5'-phosphate oxidase family protein n=1 Tax=Marinimicrobium sp. ABcell2 TaxID=3069751 RepID=UPI0027B13259|nr:pyridoxamine 5'-phosphate oxidase family protein [Marinimicrobium sp. ABcell2]MDQ2078397.1 pyridoxamine 5'-phosphate oxidase family protein [Marinimicrobium sp. ABcell2]